MTDRAITLRLVLGGLKSYLPALSRGYRGTVGESTGQYCYSVWLRHQVAIANVLPGFNPKSVVELGPGDSLGLGCAALLSGAEHYVGLDVVAHADPMRDAHVFEELVRLFERRAPIPDDTDLPLVYPRLPAYAFPRRLFTDDGPRNIRLDHSWVESIRAALLHRRQHLYDDLPLGYRAPWHGHSIDRDTTDLVITQAVLQDMAHDDRSSKLADTFRAMARWLRTGGVMSHQINFAFPGATEWNHHWRYSDAAWSIVRGNRPFFENRAPLSTYLALCERNRCEVLSVTREEKTGLPRERVAPRFRQLSDEDFRTASAHIVAVKR